MTLYSYLREWTCATNRHCSKVRIIIIIAIVINKMNIKKECYATISKGCVSAR